MKKQNYIVDYALFDSRANNDVDEAVCYEVAQTLNEAVKLKRTDYPDAVIFMQVSVNTEEKNVRHVVFDCQLPF